MPASAQAAAAIRYIYTHGLRRFTLCSAHLWEPTIIFIIGAEFAKPLPRRSLLLVRSAHHAASPNIQNEPTDGGVPDGVGRSKLRPSGCQLRLRQQRKICALFPSRPMISSICKQCIACVCESSIRSTTLRIVAGREPHRSVATSGRSRNRANRLCRYLECSVNPKGSIQAQ